ncbi:MAG TPA: peptide chain release factor N(5)-glutamine methyltransferase [Polyangia bacterium]|nr:peptide chain release factor N(5)-glutamine methyltransferase [Polyangia bacterium]
MAAEQVWTVLRALTWTADRFARAGLASPRLDAELLLAAATSLDRVALYTGFDRPLSAAERTRYRQLVQQRLDGQPVAYLVGKREFFSLELLVDARVLIPRPETEHVVEAALDAIDALGERKAVRVVDVGTGSGAIAIAIKREQPSVRVLATELEPGALEVARKNAARHDVEIEFFEGDLLEPVRACAPFDLVVSNPPYIRTADLTALEAEVRAEPRAALDGGLDGLAILGRLVVQAAPLLAAAGGALVTEIGADQGPAACALVRATGAFAEPRVLRDLAGHDRVLVATRT